jgi:DNA repair exonuclease SbcCD ATPase subunit
MDWKAFLCSSTLIGLLFCASPGQAYETAPPISDREIVERLTRLEEGQKAIIREMDQRFESIDKRFESIDKRFESIDNRFDSIDNRFQEINARFEQLNNLVIGILASFAALVAAIIGFAIWDRMSFLSRAREQAKEVYLDLNHAEREELEATRRDVHSMLQALRTLADKSPDVRTALEKFRLL